MQIKADEVEQYPAVALWLPGDEDYENLQHSHRVIELTDAEVTELRTARDAWRAWENRLLDMLDSPQAVQTTPEDMGLL